MPIRKRIEVKQKPPVVAKFIRWPDDWKNEELALWIEDKAVAVMDFNQGVFKNGGNYKVDGVPNNQASLYIARDAYLEIAKRLRESTKAGDA